jgi:methylmalonyl-CoA/ethylmalonyl-CoA epimerase
VTADSGTPKLQRDQGEAINHAAGIHLPTNSSAGLRAVDHVAIVVHSIDQSLSLYTERLGLQLMHDEVLTEINVRLAYLDCGNTALQLVEPLGSGAISDHLDARGEGLHHICFVVDQIEDSLQEMTENASTEIFQGGRNRRACFLTYRPNGIRIEITESREKNE